MSLPLRKASRTHSSPAIHARTRASMAEKSETTKRRPSEGMKAVRISSEKTKAVSPNRVFMVSKSPSAASSRARARSGSVFLARLCVCTRRPAQRPERLAP